MVTQIAVVGKGAVAPSPLNDVGCFHIEDIQGALTIGWAVLQPNDDLLSGKIIIDVYKSNDTDQDAINKASWRRAALQLNKRLGNAVIDRVNCYGEAPEEAFYRSAGVQPTWRWFGPRRSGLIDALNIEIRPGLGLRPMTPFDRHADPERRAIVELSDYRDIRKLVLRVRSCLSRL